LPSEQEKVVAAKRAAVGLKEPLERCLDGISAADASEIDRSAMRAVFGEQPRYGTDHEPSPAFGALVATDPAGCGGGVE
jgi:hypothetical protein